MPAEMMLRRLTAEERDAMWEFARRHALEKYSAEEFCRRYPARLVAGLMAERRRRLAGFLLYAIHDEGVAISVVTVSVVPAQRRRGVGSALLTELARRLQAAGPVRIDALVGERDLEAQLFLRANGFRAARVLPAAFAGGADDGYCFERHVGFRA